VRLVDHFDRDRVARACGGEHGLGVDAVVITRQREDFSVTAERAE
jgi:hypothetical protein